MADLRLELSLALTAASEPDRQAALTYARTVRALRWSGSGVTAYEHALAEALEVARLEAPRSVCADMQAWVQSGYRTLSTATKVLSGEFDAIERRLIRGLRLLGGFGPSDPLLLYEGPAEKALARKVAAVERKVVRWTIRNAAIQTKLNVALGIESQAEVEASEHPAKGSVAIAHGRTAAGGRYTIWVEPRAHAVSGHCRVDVSVEESSTSQGSVIQLGFGNGPCLSRAHPKAPSVVCVNGLLRIEAQTPRRVRSVRLRLSDGRTISSRVALVPARLGGPLGFYYQVVRGPSPIPVSLTEVNAAGRALRTVRLHPVRRCAKHQPKQRPRHVATVVRGRLPQGGTFSIVGERETFRGHSHTSFRAEVEAEGEGGVDLFASLGIPGSGGRRSPFDRLIQKGCRPGEYAVVFGVLRARRDRVLVRSAGALQALHKARIPADLHVKGVLAYVALPAVPSEVLVRAPSGKTVLREDLTREAREEREMCEGEAEGAG